MPLHPIAYPTIGIRHTFHSFGDFLRRSEPLATTSSGLIGKIIFVARNLSERSLCRDSDKIIHTPIRQEWQHKAPGHLHRQILSHIIPMLRVL